MSKKIKVGVVGIGVRRVTPWKLDDHPDVEVVRRDIIRGNGRKSALKHNIPYVSKTTRI